MIYSFIDKTAQISIIKIKQPDLNE